jgi:hypothetical protein
MSWSSLVRGNGLEGKTKNVEALDAAHEAFWKPDLIWNSWGDALAPVWPHSLVGGRNG